VVLLACMTELYYLLEAVACPLQYMPKQSLRCVSHIGTSLLQGFMRKVFALVTIQLAVCVGFAVSKLLTPQQLLNYMFVMLKHASSTQGCHNICIPLVPNMLRSVSVCLCPPSRATSAHIVGQ
jgi:hypothetical protein